MTGESAAGFRVHIVLSAGCAGIGVLDSRLIIIMLRILGMDFEVLWGGEIHWMCDEYID